MARNKKRDKTILGKSCAQRAPGYRASKRETWLGRAFAQTRFLKTYETGGEEIAAAAPDFNLRVIIDLNPSNILVKPSAYTLGYYNGGCGACMLRNWTFSGSIDGINWDILKEHVKDESITRARIYLAIGLY